MKIVALVLSIIALGTSELRVSEVRALYWKSNDNKSIATTLSNKLKNVKEGSHDPILLGYKGSSEMMMANHAKDPFKKLSLFKTGKTLLDRSIELEASNVELRFLRYAVQSNTPSFLGYNANINSDKKFVCESLSAMKDKDLQSKIITYMLNSDELEPAEKLAVKKLQATL